MSISPLDPAAVDEPATEAAQPESVSGSALDFLRARREELVAEEAAFDLIEVPAWKGALAIRYEYPDGGADDIIKAVAKAQQGNDRVFDANLDVLIACATNVLGRQPGGDWQPLDPDDSRPLRFTNRLAALLGITVPETLEGNPAKFICRNVFSPRAEATGKYEGDLAITATGGRLIQFLQKGYASADSRLVGE